MPNGIVICFIKIGRFQSNGRAIFDRNNKGIIMQNLNIIFSIMFCMCQRGFS